MREFCRVVLLVNVHGVPQPVAEDVEGEQGERQHRRREHKLPRRGVHLAGAVGDQDSPACLRFLTPSPRKLKKLSAMITPGTVSVA